jgi:hypothetical protein
LCLQLYQGNLYTGEGDLLFVQSAIYLKLAVSLKKKKFCFISVTTKPTVD